MWSAKTRVVPVVVGALGTIGKGLCNHLHRILGDSSPCKVQLIALLGTALILRKVLG